MATAGSAASGALSGAAAGAALGPWGAAAGAGLGLISSLMQGDSGAAAQQQITEDQLQTARNEQGYSHGLNAEALRRAIAGSIDAQGNTIRYDPATNSWVSSLGKQAADQQASLNSASLLRNGADVAQSTQNNAASSIQASLARRGMSGALNTLENYQPKSQAEVLGALQDSSTRANQVSQGPIIADTLRQFARTGTAAGPVLAQLERANSDSLSKEMSDNVVKSMTGTGEINNANRQALTTPIQTLTAAGTPNQQNTTPSYTQGPASEIAAQVNGRATGSATPASAGAGTNAYGTIAGNQATGLRSAAALNDPSLGQIKGMYQSADNIMKSFGGGGSSGGGIGDSINRWFNGTQGVSKGSEQFGPPNPALGQFNSTPDYTNF